MVNIPLGEWKLKYGRIFKIRLDEKDIYFRLLNAGEIETYKNNPRQISKVIDSVILNNESLSSTGAKYKLSDFVITNSFPDSEDSMKEKVLHHRYKVKDDFVLNLIAKLCSVYVSYTPDQLKAKSLDQLLELMAIAELMIGKKLLEDKKAKKPNMGMSRSVQERMDTKFSKPAVDELMEDSADALQAAMMQFGKKAPTLSEVKAKKGDKPLSDMQKQMRELNKALT
jgi:hypothetical protein